MVVKEKWNILISFLTIVMFLIVTLLWITLPNEFTLNISATVFFSTLFFILIGINFNYIKKYIQSSYFSKLINALITIGLVLVILGFVNYIGFKHPKLIDFTEKSRNTLSSRSIKILKSVKNPIEFKLFSSDANYESFSRFFRQFKFINSNINVDYISPDHRPDLVKKFNILDPDTLIIKYGIKKEYVRKYINELSVINALIKVTREREPLIFYSNGNSELDLKSNKVIGGLSLANVLSNSSYRIHRVDLREIASIPKNVKTLILWGPKIGYADKEVSLIEKYLNQGGGLIVAIDPQLNMDYFKNLRTMLKKFDVNIKNNLVVDRLRSASGSNGMAPLIKTFNKSHSITSEFTRTTMLFPVTSSVEQVKKNDLKFKSEFLTSTSNFPGSWGETSFKDLGKGVIKFDSKKDQKGALSTAMSFESENQRIVAFGNSSFVSNRFSHIRDNFSLFINSLSWVSDEERLISLDIPSIDEKPLFLSTTITGLIFSLQIILFPLLFIFLSIYFYRIKKK